MLFGLFSRKRALEFTATADHSSPPPEPPLTPSPPPDAPDVAALRAHILAVPPQTLHSYTVSRLHSHLQPAALQHLAAFFAALAPPPQLHCVRCHKAFFEIENTDRSCLVAHDDESAEVERVSAQTKGKGTLYETTWGCCGKTVEGDGDMGPPDGWCYEGQHTTDIKRARFRADSTMHDDKLVSCERLRCGMPLRSTRKRPRQGDDDADERSSVSSSHPSTNASPRSSNGRKKARTRAPPPAVEMDVGHDNGARTPSPVRMPSSPNTNSRVKPKLKPKPKSKSKPASTSTTAPKTSSPLVLAPPFVSRPSSPDAVANKAQVVITSSSAPASASPARSRKDSGVSVGKGRSKVKPNAKTKARPLEEVVDSSVDAERAVG